jgi:hypothetical protein
MVARTRPDGKCDVDAMHGLRSAIASSIGHINGHHVNNQLD